MNRIKLLLLGLFAAVSDTLHRATVAYMEAMGAIRYAAHTFVASHTDALYYVSANLPATYDSAGYGATTLTWTLIGKVKSFLPYGSQRNVNEWVPIAGAVEYTKGAPRYGSGDMMLGDIPADAGQVILKAAEASPNHYSFKIIYPDNEIHYLDGLVSAWRLSQAGEGQPMERTATINICKAPVVIAAT